MVGYRRNKPNNPDEIFFLTIVTANRHPWFTDPPDAELVITVMKRLRNRFDLKFKAWIILPDHVLWLLQPGKSDYSKVMFAFKRAIGAELKRQGYLSKGQRMWQDRFWEHTIRDDDDYNRCVEYIHYNPVKHGLVKSPIDWVFSSFGEYVRRGIYPKDWAYTGQDVIAGAKYD